jgi:ATP-dependent DNA helicase RecG
LNAIIHRDYGTGNPIHIHIYPDKVLIYNDGRLPETWTVEDLFAPHTSKPYNPLIAGAFFRSGQIEAWGRGIKKITEACKSWGKPEPFYNVRPDEVMIGFSTEPQFGEKFTDEFVEKFVENEVHRTIIKLMIQQPTTSAKKMAGKAGMTSRGIQKNIDVLKKRGFVERIGSAKGGHWVVELPQKEDSM